MTSRHAIYCPTHHHQALVSGDLRWCAVGNHRLARWWVVDVQTKRVLDEVSEEKGVEREIHQALADCQRLALADVCMTEKEKKRMPRGIKGSGPTSKAGKKTGALETAYYEAGARLLKLALVAHVTSTGAQSWRVTFEERPRGSKAADRGTAHVAASEESGRAAYADARTKVAGMGWQPATADARVIRPIPAPPAAAKKKSA